MVFTPKPYKQRAPRGRARRNTLAPMAVVAAQIEVENPATGETSPTVPELGADEVAASSTARAAQPAWASPASRSAPGS